MKILVYILVLFFTNSAISKENNQKTSQKQEKNTQKDEKQEEKTIKFHKPETEAERALDEILVADTISLSNDKYYGMYYVIEINEKGRGDFIDKKATKEQITTAEMLRKGVLFTSNFLKSADIEKIHPYHNLNCEVYDGEGTPPFGYYTYKEKNDKYYIFTTTMPNGTGVVTSLNALNELNTYSPHYIVKYENNTWKIDALCCHNVKVNFSE